MNLLLYSGQAHPSLIQSSSCTLMHLSVYPQGDIIGLVAGITSSGFLEPHVFLIGQINMINMIIMMCSRCTCNQYGLHSSILQNNLRH